MVNKYQWLSDDIWQQFVLILFSFGIGIVLNKKLDQKMFINGLRAKTGSSPLAFH